LLVSNPLVFSTLELKSTIFSIGFCVGKRDCFVVVVLTTKRKRSARESLWSFDYPEITCT